MNFLKKILIVLLLVLNSSVSASQQYMLVKCFMYPSLTEGVAVFSDPDSGKLNSAKDCAAALAKVPTHYTLLSSVAAGTDSSTIVNYLFCMNKTTTLHSKSLIKEE